MNLLKTGRTARVALQRGRAMPALKAILFPTDFSESAVYAWQYAITLAKEFKAVLYVLHVLELPPAESFPSRAARERAVRELRRKGEARLATWVQGHGLKRSQLRPLTAWGTPTDEILATAKETRADLIVMATHGRTGLAHLLVGSVAEKVVRLSPCPVLTVKPPAMQLKVA